MSKQMKYMVMMNSPGAKYQIFEWSKPAIEAHMAFMRNLNQKLRESGELVSAEGLSDPGQAKLVRAGDKGEPITDGVFPETKEFLAGFWIVDVESPERVYALAAEISGAPGPDGKPLRMPVEVRQVMFSVDCGHG